MSSSLRTSGRTCTHPEVDEGAPREPVRRHWKMAMGKISTFTLPSCALSFTCPPFTCRPPLSLGLQHQQQVSNVQKVLDAAIKKPFARVSQGALGTNLARPEDPACLPRG